MAGFIGLRRKSIEVEFHTSFSPYADPVETVDKGSGAVVTHVVIRAGMLELKALNLAYLDAFASMDRPLARLPASRRSRSRP